MFKVRELIAQVSVTIGGYALRIYDGNLHFRNEQVATIDTENTLVGGLLSVNSSGSIVSVNDTSILTIHIDGQDGEDEVGYGSEELPLKTLSYAVSMASAFKMFQSVEFILNGDAELTNSQHELGFSSEVIFSGKNQQEVNLIFNTDGTSIGTLNINSRARVVFNGVSISTNGVATEIAPMLKGRMSEVVLIHNSIALVENIPLIETLYNVDLRLLDTEINNSEEKIFINSGGSRVSITGDGESSLSSSLSSDICYYIATDGNGNDTNVFISMI